MPRPTLLWAPRILRIIWSVAACLFAKRTKWSLAQFATPSTRGSSFPKCHFRTFPRSLPIFRRTTFCLQTLSPVRMLLSRVRRACNYPAFLASLARLSLIHKAQKNQTSDKEGGSSQNRRTRRSADLGGRAEDEGPPDR